MHEHLFLDLRKTHLPHVVGVDLPGRSEPILTSDDFPATELARWEAKVDVGNIRAAKDAEPIADNYILADEGVAVAEVMEFRNNGGRTIVDVTSIGLKRDPEALLRVSEATGLHIVMGTGYYQRVYHPLDMDQRSVEDLTEVIVTDVTEGVNGTGIRSGIIGEIGVNGGPIRPNEEKSIRAAGLASVITGAPISLHRGGVGAERHQTLDILEEVGVDLERVILGHSDEIADDLGLMLELLERGPYIQLDLIGRDEVVRSIDVLGPEEGLGPSVTVRDAEAIPRLIEAGYEDKVLLSHDVCWKTHLKRYGGFGYSFILERFIPHLLNMGVGESSIEKMTVTNPARILVFAEPRAS
jgi:phosphotriesterase-related protein